MGQLIFWRNRIGMASYFPYQYKRTGFIVKFLGVQCPYRVCLEEVRDCEHFVNRRSLLRPRGRGVFVETDLPGCPGVRSGQLCRRFGDCTRAAFEFGVARFSFAGLRWSGRFGQVERRFSGFVRGDVFRGG